ncbi:hypothetical protein C2845_PM07G33710 [Panicum miliaceum]|uniref:DUF1618 domain-containing protein n=1 Tax=Panicum miliaceum TaxID=4540 RepID=A0A3L6SKC4_PANMI|nr:hypothetical protein C2845_PM07G33710 [Panicum miliaceum]
MMKARVKQHSSAFAPAFLPAPGSPLGPGERALTAFVADDDGTFNYAQPLAARRGIVLMRLVPRACFERTATTGGFVVGLCNPLTGERHVAPPLQCCTCLGRHVNDYAILIAADCNVDERPSSSGRFAFSRLLLTGHHQDDRHLYLHSYSGATRSWSARATRLHSDQFRMAGADAAVVHRGAAHWLYFDVRRPKDARYDLYVLRAEAPFLCVSGDGRRLSIASVHATRVEVWTQQHGDDDDDGDYTAWLRTQSIQIPPAQRLADYSFRFHVNKGAMLAMYKYNGDGDGDGAVLVVDIERKVVEKVMDCSPDLGYRSCVPYEMDLPEFFL